MATHQSIRYLQQRASQSGLVIHLGNLNFKAKKTDVENLFKERGFNKCIFFWPDVPPNQPGEHKGWCRVQFEETEVAERAKSDLHNAPLMGRPIKIGVIENTATAPRIPAQRAQAHATTAPTIPIIGQPAQDPSTPSEALRSLRLTEYPKSWLNNLENPGLARESVMARMKQLERAYEDAGVVARPLVKDEGGILMLRSQQYPSPAPQNDIFANKPWICVVKGEGKQRESKTIELARLPEFEADGWKEWIYAGRPTEPGTDKDPRKILKINDVWHTDAPYNDTAHMFAAEIEMSRRADGIDWQPGQLLGRDPHARAPISHSPTFIPPPESSKTLQSATSRGHQLIFPRPAGVGAGWGDHDLFREWQLHGRQVKKSMVENKEWDKVPPSTIEFVPPPRLSGWNTWVYHSSG